MRKQQPVSNLESRASAAAQAARHIEGATHEPISVEGTRRRLDRIEHVLLLELRRSAARRERAALRIVPPLAARDREPPAPAA